MRPLAFAPFSAGGTRLARRDVRVFAILGLFALVPACGRVEDHGVVGGDASADVTSDASHELDAAREAANDRDTGELLDGTWADVAVIDSGPPADVSVDSPRPDSSISDEGD